MDKSTKEYLDLKFETVNEKFQTVSDSFEKVEHKFERIEDAMDKHDDFTTKLGTIVYMLTGGIVLLGYLLMADLLIFPVIS